MHERTQATLARLEQSSWFYAVGKQDTDAAIVLASWDEAIESCRSLTWENLLLEAVNQYRERILEISRERFKQWNQVIRELKVVTIPLVEWKTAAVMDAHQLPKVFLDTVNWDILNVAVEAEFADVYPPGFFASQAYWYMRGHFPCGWKGVFPEGELIIY